jgi:hypothetical protein
VYYLNAHLFIFSAVPRASGPVFMFCAPEYVFDGADVGSCFHVLCCRTRLRRYRGRRLPFSCFARLNSFSAILTASSPIFKFCAAGHVFGGAEGIGSRFHVLRHQTRFRKYRGRRVPFSYFAHLDWFSAVPWASAPIFMFCALELVFGGTEGRQLPFSCFARLNSFSAVSRASAPVIMFCAPGLIFGGTEGVMSRFYVLHTRTHFRRNRGRRLPFS